MEINSENSKKYALIGYPLGHSMSPIIHKELLKIASVNGKYDLAEILKEDLETSFYEKLKRLNGFNITIPHKINIIPLLDKLSPKAKLFGSVNTVDIKDNKTIGYNTDCDGFLRSLEAENIKLAGNVLICGSGGVSRMFAFESALAGAEVTLAVRNSSLNAANDIKKEMQEKLSKDCNIIFLSEAKGGYDLIINGTPVGMYPNIDNSPLEEKVIKSSKAVFDAIYNPIETKFIKYAREGGLKYVNGLPMLVWQAAVAEEIWNDVKFSKEDINKVIDITKKELEKHE